MESQPPAADTVVPAVWPASSNTELVKTYYRVKSGDTLGDDRTHVQHDRCWRSGAGTHIQGSTIRTGDRLTVYTARAN